MGYSMRTDRHRYTEWRDQRKQTVIARELYDHTTDWLENTNVAAAPENRQTADELSKLMWTLLPQPPKL
jgi:iduronate 2-sulfatase